MLPKSSHDDVYDCFIKNGGLVAVIYGGDMGGAVDVVRYMGLPFRLVIIVDKDQGKLDMLAAKLVGVEVAKL
jgi:hypothetical protein